MLRNKSGITLIAFLRHVVELNIDLDFEKADESTAEKVVWNIVD